MARPVVGYPRLMGADEAGTVRGARSSRGGPAVFSRPAMLIRYGYEMTFACSAPTPMVCQLDVRPSCVPAVRAETPFAARPHVELWLYADVFGNRENSTRRPANSRSPMPASSKSAAFPIPSSPMRLKSWLRICLTTRCSTSSAAAMSKPTSSARSPGTFSVTRGRAGRACRRSAISSTAISTLAMRARARRARPMKPMPSASACAAISRISRSRFAAA